MKIRNGFVSNSSSSSFICIIKKEALDKINNGIDIGISESELKVLKSIKHWSSPVDVFGTPCCVIQYEDSGESGDLSDVLTDEEIEFFESNGCGTRADVISTIRHKDIWSRISY